MLVGGGGEDAHAASRAGAEGNVGDWHPDRLAGVGGEHHLVVGGDGEERDQRPAAHRPVHGRDALAAADRAVLLRDIVRNLAHARGQQASFAPLLEPDAVGNGVHVHFSLRDSTGAPVTYDPARPGGLSAVAGSFAAHFEHTFTVTPQGAWVLTAVDGGRSRLAALGVPFGGR